MAVTTKDAGKTKEKEKAKKTQKSSKEQQANLFRGMMSELKKVSWPTKKEVAVYTSVVVATVIVFTLVIGAYDFLLSRLMDLLLSL